MRVVYTVLVVGWMVVIFCFSNQPATESGELSSSVINNTIVRVYKLFKPDMNKEDTNKVIEGWSTLIRKTAHFTIYFILGVLVALMLRSYGLDNINVIVYAILICFLYAGSDEFHQLFIPGRSCMLFDVFIDTLGSFIGIELLNIFGKLN